jgi:hypothetical protein
MINFGRWTVEARKDTHYLEYRRHVKEDNKQRETEFLLNFSWPSNMMVKMRNLIRPKLEHILKGAIEMEF